MIDFFLNSYWYILYLFYC